VSEFQQLPDTRDEMYFRARMTNSQIEALAYYLRQDRIKPAIVRFLGGNFKFKRHVKYNRDKCTRYLVNSWNTERVLREQRNLDDEAKKFAIQWAFPQAYYACFLQILSFFKASGAGETSHAAVVRKVGQLLVSGRYPKELMWYADGGLHEIKLTGVQKYQMPSSYYLDLENHDSVQNQIAQFLSSTRKKQLEDRRQSIKEKFRTAKGNIKKRLTAEEWCKVSDSLGVTNVISLLYRKRLKANYEDIDTFLASEIDGRLIMDGLCGIVSNLGFVHEAMLARTLGKDEFREVVKGSKTREKFISQRHNIVLDSF
jgi:hypothetical protein